MSDDEDIVLGAWTEYLAAFDCFLVQKRSTGDARAALDARREMLAILQADPDYWRSRRERRERLACRRERASGMAAAAARARWGTRTDDAA